MGSSNSKKSGSIQKSRAKGRSNSKKEECTKGAHQIRDSKKEELVGGTSQIENSETLKRLASLHNSSTLCKLHDLKLVKIMPLKLGLKLFNNYVIKTRKNNQ